MFEEYSNGEETSFSSLPLNLNEEINTNSYFPEDLKIEYITSMDSFIFNKLKLKNEPKVSDLQQIFSDFEEHYFADCNQDIKISAEKALTANQRLLFAILRYTS